MEKKRYIVPTLKVHEIESEDILAASGQSISEDGNKADTSNPQPDGNAGVARTKFNVFDDFDEGEEF